MYHLLVNEKIETPFFDTTSQPIKDANMLFHQYFPQFRDVCHFPIDLFEWRKVDESLKNHTWDLTKVIRIFNNYLF